MTQVLSRLDGTGTTSSIPLSLRPLEVQFVGNLISGHKQLRKTVDALAKVGIVDSKGA